MTDDGRTEDRSTEDRAGNVERRGGAGSGPERGAPRWMRVLAGAAALFGLLTLVSGGKVIFGPEEARIAAGAYMPFVVWFNFLAGFAYLLAAWAMWRGRPWSCALSAGIAAATLVVYAIFGFKAMTGTPFEMRTVGAMALRSGFWLAAAYALCKWHGRARAGNP